MRAFPPRPADEPVFYPATGGGDAEQMARQACTGGREHEELWGPAGDSRRSTPGSAISLGLAS